MSIAPAKLDLSDSLFIPPEADQYVDTVLSYWDYAFANSDKDDLTLPYAPRELDEAEKILRERYPHVALAVDRLIIASSMNRDFR